MPFKTLGLSKQILKAIHENGFTNPTPIQTQVIPLILKGEDIMARAQTGTGKSASFILPLIQLLSEIKAKETQKKAKIRILVLRRQENLHCK